MKYAILLSYIFYFSSLFAQTEHLVSFGPDQVISASEMDGTKNSNFAIDLTSGYLDGQVNNNYQNDELIVQDNRLTVKLRNDAVCFTSHVVDVTDNDQASLSIDFSGNGTLDADGRSDWLDWIDIYHALDGNWELHADAKNNKHSIQGTPSHFQSKQIALNDAQDFQVKVCMLVTGEDESYTLENLKITTNGDRKNSTTSQQAEVLISPEIELYPNPSNQFIFLNNKEAFQLDRFEIIDQEGKVITRSSYPVDVSDLDSGVHWLRLQEKSGKTVSKSFVVAH